MKRIALSFILSALFALGACLPVSAADIEGWQFADGPSTEAGVAESVLGRLILHDGRVETAAQTVEAVASLVADELGNEIEPLVYRNGAPLGESEIVATGDEIRFADQSEDSVMIIVKGDVVGTGKPGLMQLIQIAKAMRGNLDLSGAQAEAADLNESGKTDLGDVVIAAKYIQAGTGAQETAAARAAVQASPEPSAASTDDKDEPEGILEMFTRQVLEGTNVLRAENSIEPALILSEGLCEAAQVRADELAASGVLSHTRPDGSKYSTVATLGPRLVLGENIHCNKGYELEETAEVALDGWENSQPHRKQMLEPRYTHTGIAFAQATDGTWFCVQVFSNGDDVVSVDTPKA